MWILKVSRIKGFSLGAWRGEQIDGHMKASSRKEREEVLPIRDGKGSVLLNTRRAKMPMWLQQKGSGK